MKSHELVVRIRDDERLTELEETIARGQQTFVDVGRALAEIRDLRLYRREYGSFSEYCQKKWGWEKRYTQYVIAGAEAVQSLPEDMRTIVRSEAAARELGKAEPAERAEVVQAIVDEGKPITAKEIKRHLPQPPPRSLVVDATGWPIPAQLLPLWNRASEVQELLTMLSRVQGALRNAQENPAVLFAGVNFSSALLQLDQAWCEIETAMPFAVCPACQGEASEGCTLCKGRGLISEQCWNTCVTREDKEFRLRAKGQNRN